MLLELWMYHIKLNECFKIRITQPLPSGVRFLISGCLDWEVHEPFEVIRKVSVYVDRWMNEKAIGFTIFSKWSVLLAAKLSGVMDILKIKQITLITMSPKRTGLWAAC